MPKLSAKVTTSATTSVNLKPELLTALATLVATHEKLQRKIEELEAERDKAKAAVDELCRKHKKYSMLEAGFKVDGVPVKLVSGIQRSKDMEAIRDRLLELGEEDPLWIEHNAIREKPKKAYIKIGGGGKRKGGGEDDE